MNQPFPSLASDFTVTMSVPDGDWQVVLNAPMGGVRGAVTAQNGNSMRIDKVLGSSASETLTSFGGCAAQDMVNGTDCGNVSVGRMSRRDSLREGGSVDGWGSDLTSMAFKVNECERKAFKVNAIERYSRPCRG